MLNLTDFKDWAILRLFWVDFWRRVFCPWGFGIGSPTVLCGLQILIVSCGGLQIHRSGMFEKSTLLCLMPFPSVRQANPPQRVLLSPLLHYAPFYIPTQRTPAACISIVCPFPASKQFFFKIFFRKSFCYEKYSYICTGHSSVKDCKYFVIIF